MMLDVSSNKPRVGDEKLGCTTSESGDSLSTSELTFGFKESWFVSEMLICGTKKCITE